MTITADLVDLIVSTGGGCPGTTIHFVLTGYAQGLVATGLFDALPDDDVPRLAVSVAMLAWADDGPAAMREHADMLRHSGPGCWLADADTVAAAFNTAADVLDAL